MVDGALHEEFGLLLCGHGGKAFNFVVREFCRRGGERIAPQLNDAFEFGPGSLIGAGLVAAKRRAIKVKPRRPGGVF